MKAKIRPISWLVVSAILTGCHSTTESITHTVNQDTLARTGKVNTTDVTLYGAEVYSHDKVTFGKFIMRMKMVSTPGVVSSFFTYDNRSWQGGIPWREIDIEVIGKSPDQLQTNLITGELNRRVHSEGMHTVANIDQFHEYTLIWTPDHITWQVDGEVLHSISASESQQVIDMRDSPQSYRMNLWVSEAAEWVGRFDQKDLPLHQYIDWMEYHRYEDGQFKLEWRDDFMTFDSQRWGRGDWGFDGNLVTFTPKNVAIKNEMLVLRLTAD